MEHVAMSSSLCNRQLLAWIVSLFLGVAVLLAPVWWNGFPLVFFDSGGYVRRALTMELQAGRSIFYGLYLWGASLGWRFWLGPVLIQALACLWLLHLVLRSHHLPAGPVTVFLLTAALSLGTGIAWSTGQLMPDIWVPLAALALYLLGFSWSRLGLIERCGLMLVVQGGLLFHMSALAMAIGLVVVTAGLWLVAGKRRWTQEVRLLPPLATVAAALVLMPLLHLFLVGQAAYTPGGSGFVFGRLVQAGIAQRWLQEHCPVPGIRLCSLQDRIPENGDEFLWGEQSAFRELGQWSGEADAELGYLVRACITTYPSQVLWAAVQATAQQVVMVKSVDQLGEIHNDTRDVFTNILPRATSLAFNGARQQKGEITPALVEGVNRIHVPVSHLSGAAVLLVMVWAWRTRRPHLFSLALFVFFALLGNAFICGALSNPHDRYQSRVVWLASLVAIVAVWTWRQPGDRASPSR
jgi:hypothetical protein